MPMAPTAKRPNKDEDPVAWNKDWEEELRQLYVLAHGDIKNVRLAMGVPVKLTTSAEEILQIEKQNGGTALLQNDIRGFALARMATDDFERKFKSLETSSRRDLILEALWKTANIGAGDMEGRRRWCPEMTLSNLADNGGRGFLEILGTIMTEDPTIDRSEPVHILNPLIERFWTLLNIRSKDVKQEFQSHRSYFISMFIWRTLLAFVSKATIQSPDRNSCSDAVREG